MGYRVNYNVRMTHDQMTGLQVIFGDAMLLAALWLWLRYWRGRGRPGTWQHGPERVGPRDGGHGALPYHRPKLIGAPQAGEPVLKALGQCEGARERTREWSDS